MSGTQAMGRKFRGGGGGWAYYVCMEWAYYVCVGWAYYVCMEWAYYVCLGWAYYVCMEWAYYVCMGWAYYMCMCDEYVCFKCDDCACRMWGEYGASLPTCVSMPRSKHFCTCSVMRGKCNDDDRMHSGEGRGW